MLLHVCHCHGVCVTCTRLAVKALVGEGCKGDDSHPPALNGTSEPWSVEEGYFASYSHFKIHEEMLKVSFLDG